MWPGCQLLLNRSRKRTDTGSAHTLKLEQTAELLKAQKPCWRGYYQHDTYPKFSCGDCDYHCLFSNYASTAIVAMLSGVACATVLRVAAIMRQTRNPKPANPESSTQNTTVPGSIIQRSRSTGHSLNQSFKACGAGKLDKALLKKPMHKSRGLVYKLPCFGHCCLSL